MRKIWLLGLLLLITMPTFAQDSVGHGVIREGNVTGSRNLGVLNPLLCTSAPCRRLNSLMFPTLIGVDLARGVYGSADQVGNGLATFWEMAGDTVEFHLRDNLFWSDGTPITAYDVFYSYLALKSDDFVSDYSDDLEIVTSAAPSDARTIQFVYEPATCGGVGLVNIPIIPVHVFDPNFSQIAADFFDASNAAEQYAAWTQVQPRDFRFMLDHPFNAAPTVTGGSFVFDEIRYTENTQLVSENGELAYDYLDMPDRFTEVDMFLRGELNFISNPPFDRRDDIRAAAERGEVNYITYPGNTWYGINFNLANPNDPEDAFDRDGEPIDQGIHPVFGDVRVRQAFQKAIDVQAVLESAFYGDGSIMPANQTPTSWAFNRDLPPVSYDPVGAAALLEEAGWIDENGDGRRECIRCQTAREGRELSANLFYADDSRYSILVEVIRQQLVRVGMEIYPIPDSSENIDFYLRDQSYDSALIVTVEDYPVDPDQTDLFTRAADVVGERGNTGSYYNPEVEELLAQARTLEGCDLEARAEIYRRIQAILQADQPFAWLFVIDQMLAARSGVQGFNPYPQAPFWNVDEWVIVR
jgi:peptide/nickel transport system substrate-binding protein